MKNASDAPVQEYNITSLLASNSTNIADWIKVLEKSSVQNKITFEMTELRDDPDYIR